MHPGHNTWQDYLPSPSTAREMSKAQLTAISFYRQGMGSAQLKGHLITHSLSTISTHPLPKILGISPIEL